jgi:hypothetical protein
MSQRWLDVQHQEIRERNARRRAEQARQIEERAQAAKARRR